MVKLDVKIKSAVRCFRRLGDGNGRAGIWVMTRPSGYRGAFFHGDRCEIQVPRYTVEELGEFSSEAGGSDFCEEITPDEVVETLDETWFAAAREAENIFARHPVEEEQNTRLSKE